MRNVFKDLPIVAYRRDTNLCDVLVHGKTNRTLRKVNQPCQDGCDMCALIAVAAIQDSMGQKTFDVIKNVNCQQRNVVYAINCARCGVVVYVGETERQLQERMKEHLRDVRLEKDKPINGHFSASNHSCADLRFSILQKMYTTDRIERQINESAWIYRLKTARPLGCNVKDARYHLVHTDVG